MSKFEVYRNEYNENIGGPEEIAIATVDAPISYVGSVGELVFQQANGATEAAFAPGLWSRLKRVDTPKATD